MKRCSRSQLKLSQWSSTLTEANDIKTSIEDMLRMIEDQEMFESVKVPVQTDSPIRKTIKSEVRSSDKA